MKVKYGQISRHMLNDTIDKDENLKELMKIYRYRCKIPVELIKEDMVRAIESIGYSKFTHKQRNMIFRRRSREFRRRWKQIYPRWLAHKSRIRSKKSREAWSGSRYIFPTLSNSQA